MMGVPLALHALNDGAEPHPGFGYFPRLFHQIFCPS
jgi:hypothetical protein